MIEFSAHIQKFGQQGEKTGWTYILIPEAIANELKPGNRKSFRVKGALDNYRITGVALLPMGATVRTHLLKDFELTAILDTYWRTDLLLF